MISCIITLLLQHHDGLQTRPCQDFSVPRQTCSLRVAILVLMISQSRMRVLAVALRVVGLALDGAIISLVDTRIIVHLPRKAPTELKGPTPNDIVAPLGLLNLSATGHYSGNGLTSLQLSCKMSTERRARILESLNQKLWQPRQDWRPKVSIYLGNTCFWKGLILFHKQLVYVNQSFEGRV